MTGIRTTVAEVIGRTIAHLGVAHVFGVVGSGNFHATNALLANSDAGFTASRHESGATSMADAYTRATGELSVVSLHQGCGLSNGLTALGEAAKAHTPLLIIAGDTPGFAKTSNFWIDQDAAVTAMGAVAERIHRPETTVEDVFRAYVRAVMDRCPVVLSMPIDLQEEQLDWDVTDIPALPVRLRPALSAQAITATVDAIQAAHRPVLLAGRGARHAGEALRALGEASGALLVTSAGARGLFADDRWSLDVSGGFATVGTAEIIREADLIVVFGAALNKWTTRGGGLFENKIVVQIDDRPEAIGLHRRVDIGVVADAELAATAVRAELLSRGGRSDEGYRTFDAAQRMAASVSWSAQAYEERTDEGCIDPRTLANWLDEHLPEERVVIVDGGNFLEYGGMHLRVPDERGFCIPLSFQSIGLSVASGIGAGIAQPGRLPVVGVGDGGFLMSHVELETAVRLGQPMVVVVYNDAAYSAEVQLFGEDADLRTVTFPPTDVAAIARGYGCDAVTVRSEADFAAISTWLSEQPRRPLVVDAKIASFPSVILSHMHEIGE
ncbi:thiamine pyrophosphate-binding protein [Microbacterium sp.]|uniref:thiamine pyrophosphate-binding protein n=1 Tax=Microbacterium sp. TaxID=51671 RepID=UPI003A85572B